MDCISLEQWRQVPDGINRLIYARRLPEVSPPADWAPYLASGQACLLESARDGRYSYFVPEPKRRHTVEAGPGQPVIDALRAFFAEGVAPRYTHLPPFTGGLVGVLAYDVAREIEALPTQTQDDLGLPRAAFCEVDALLAFDHREASAYAIVVMQRPPADAALEAAFAQASARADVLLEKFDHPEHAPTSVDLRPAAQTEPVLTLDREAYIAAVMQAQAYIAAGDTYQVNLSLRETRPLQAHPSAIYDALRRINPSPYMGYLPFADWTLVCGSPELLIKGLDGALEARPIAGTRPRGSSERSDSALGGELLAHPKERAEHLMLVDLIRNDLGRVSAYGSVDVERYMTLEGYSHVQHIVSFIVSQLAEDKDTVDAVTAAFPGGTITGAPKVRTMEIIEELEPVSRGFYTGSLGWFAHTGDFELNIVIRSLLAKNGQAHVQAGAGIVADSVPAEEYTESLNKAQALWAAHEEAVKDALLPR